MRTLEIIDCKRDMLHGGLGGAKEIVNRALGVQRLQQQNARAMIQADQLGISLSRILRVQSQDMRMRRQLAAEEKAMKAPVKMLFPTVLFIFPALFVVALGPAALNLMKTFSGGN